MRYTRREFATLVAAGFPAAALVGLGESIFSPPTDAKPNSLIGGVQVGTITYSYRSMP
ncbi:MAG: xylose isomerase, partial [Acidobacteria bacterium]